MANIYRLETIAKTENGLTSFDNTPSINDDGLIAFVGKIDGTEELFVGDNLNPNVNLSTNPQFGASFFPGIEINNDNQIVAVNSGAIRLWDADNPGLYRRTIATAIFGNEFSDFDNIFPFASINNVTFPQSEESEVVFNADPKDGISNTSVGLHTYKLFGGENTYFEGPLANSIGIPMLADDGRVVSKVDNSTIRVFNYGLSQSEVIANDASLGRAPGISDNGKAIAFYGNNGGEGIFISIETNSGWERHRIAGVVGNGILDPGETYTDSNNNGEFDSGEEELGLTSSFSEFERIGINYSETDDGGLGTVTYLAKDESGNESLISSEFNISDSSQQVDVSHSLVAKVGQPANEIDTGLTGNIQDLNIYDPINNPGQIAFWTKTTTGEEAVVRASPIRKPVLIVPGILGSLPQNENVKQWLTNLGSNPELLEPEQIIRIYDDLVETLERAGYTKGVDLFVATHDWRLSPGPIDGTIDGSIDRSESELTDDTYEYSVDQLAYWMEKAEQEWKSQFPEGEPIPELPSVDVIAHSAGGSVVRSYIQSTAYQEDDFSLPKIDNFITLGVPFRGVSNPWNPRQNDFDANPILYLARLIAKTAQTKVVNGKAITLSGNDYITPNEISQLSDKEFIDRYVPALKALQATYPFIRETESSNTYRTAEYIDSNERNSLLLDLNSGFDSENGEGDNDPNKFADGVEQVTIIYGTGSAANDAVVGKIGPDTETIYVDGVGIERTIPTVLPLDGVLPVTPKEGQLWYEDRRGERDVQGDGTVPISSSFEIFENDNRSNIQSKDFDSVTHRKQPFDKDIQKFILETLGIDLKEELISTDLNNNVLDLYSIGNNGYNFAGSIILDPVEGFLVDSQGRRLGYSEATGAITEIPSSFWLGEEDGIGFFSEPVQGTFHLELTGLGENYYVSVALETEDGPAGIESEGFLAVGEQLTLDVPVVNDVNTAPIIDLNGDADGIDATASVPGNGNTSPITDSNLTIFDNESQNLAGATVTILNPEDGNSELLGATATGNITVDYDATTSILTLAGTDTITNYQQVLSSVTYTNDAANPDTTPREIEFVVNDGASFNNLSTPAIVNANFEQGDRIPTFEEISDVTVTEGETASFSFNLDSPASGDITFDYSTEDLDATAGSDYTATSGELTIAAGETTATIDIATNQDSVNDEDTEAFALNLTGLEGATFSNGETELSVAGYIENEAGPMIIRGTGRDDYLTGGTGNDTIGGGKGNDSMYGYAGDDNLRGHSDNDSIFGDLGNDSLFGSSGNDNFSGGDGQDLIKGETGMDTISGGMGNDNINGGSNPDILTGGDGNDTIRGEHGGDIIDGGAGSDNLFGGNSGGRDTFVLMTDLTTTERDIIRDFELGTDRLGVSDLSIVNELSVMSNANNTASIITNGSGEQVAILTGVSVPGINQLRFVEV